MNDEDKEIQNELDASMFHLLKEADNRYARKLVEQVLFGILGLFGVAIVMKIIQSIGL